MKLFGHNILLSAICWIVNNPSILFLSILLALAATGHMADVAGQETASILVVRLAIYSGIASCVPAALCASFMWHNYDETISRGLRRWLSTLGFFQHQLGSTIATFVIMMAFGFLLMFSTLCLVSTLTL